MRQMVIFLIFLGFLLILVACIGRSGGLSATKPPTVTGVLPPTATEVPTQQYFQPPGWARGAVVYQLFVRAFTPEGTFAAATKRLPEVRDLGADIIMLLPIHPTGAKSRVGSLGSPYSIRDYRAIDPAVGTADDFKEFIKTAHDLGLHVIMDFVANHTAWDNPLITEHPGWYTHNADGVIISPNPGWLDVADLNYQSTALRTYMIETSLYWVDTFGIDGYRCDASIMVPDDFWQSWREALKANDPDLLLLSESDGLSLYLAGFEVAYDWTTHKKFVLGMKAPTLASDLLDYVVSEQRLANNQLWRLRYLENHDQDRIALVARTPDQKELAAVFLLTLPGLPLIYAGQEIGAVERPSLFDPTTVDWADGDDELRATYTELIELRKASPALYEGALEELASEQPSIFIYERRAPNQRVVVMLNLAAEPVQVSIEGITAGHDLRSGETVDLSAGLQLAGYGYRLIEVP